MIVKSLNHNAPPNTLKAKKTLVVFGEDWQGLPSSTQHLIKPLCNQYDVIWLNSIGLRQPHFNIQDTKRIMKKLYSFFKPSSSNTHSSNKNKNKNKNTLNNHKEMNRPKEINKPKIILNIKTLPAPKNLLLRKICGKFMAYQINKQLAAIHCENPIIWASLPTAIDAIKFLNAQSIIYYCCDDFNSLAGVDHATIAQHEIELLNTAQLIIASQPTLAQNLIQRLNNHQANKNKPTKKIHQVLPHGVDYDYFSAPVIIADDLPTNGKPTAGFYGSIASWLDFDLLNTIIEHNKHWNFVFIGRIENSIKTQVAKLKAHPNTYFLGAKEHHQLSRYSQHWHASLLPFNDCEQIQNCNPLKLREYLATGVPIISTYFPAVDEYKQIVNIAHNPYEFNQHLKTIEQLNNHDKKIIQQAQQKAVEQHSWQARSQQIHQWIKAL